MSKRIRKVFRNHPEVCHVWNSQSQDDGRAGNISFEGNSIYSYGHYKIGLIIADKNVCLLQEDNYSSSTSCHIGLVFGATSNRTRFTVPFLHDDTESHESNFAFMVNKVRKSADRFWGCIDRADYKQEYYDNAVEQTIDYASIFGLTLPALFGLELSGPKAKAKLEKCRIKDEQREAKYVADTLRYDAAKKEADKHFESYEQDWIDGKINGKYSSIVIDGFTFYPSRYNFSQTRVRLTKDGKEVETSQGAFVPVGRAKRLYKLIAAKENVRGFEIGNFKVIKFNGILKIGCHDIQKDEIERFAKVMNW